MPKERSLHSNTFGVYPDRGERDPPSPVCCCRVMHIRTGAIWIAYLEMMWITTQVSFWAAKSVTSGFSPIIILLGFVFTVFQTILVACLAKGVKQFKTTYIFCYMLGVIIRIFFFSLMILFCIIFGYLQYPDEDNSYKYFKSYIGLKLIFCVVYILLKIFALHTAYRCFAYIESTRSTFCFSPVPTADMLHHSETIESTATFRTIQPNSCPLWNPTDLECRISKT